MDTVGLVEEQIDDGQRIVDQLTEEGIPMRVAFWAKLSEKDRWSFYLVTPLVEEKGSTEAYRQVWPILQAWETFG